jgi:carbohydrate diacid regulator
LIITQELAQQIVDRAMTLAQHNVNIMDEKGIIIGSGHKHRLGTFHKGAQDVIQGNRVIEIYPHELDIYPGSLPGVNWPIVLEDQLIGVVGVSGQPDEVRDTARLIKAVTELILEREVLRDEIRFHQQLREQFAVQLLSENVAANSKGLSRTAKMLDFNMDLPRFVAVADIRPLLEHARENYGNLEFAALRTRENILGSLERSDLISPEDIYAFLDNHLIVVKHCQPQNWDSQSAWGLSLGLLLASGDDRSQLPVGFGSIAPSFMNLFLSYREALFALKNTLPGITNSIYQFDIMAGYLARVAANSAECQALTQLRRSVGEKLERKYDMHATVRALLENNLNMTATAQALFIHRNTLIFRLEKLKEATSLEPSRSLNHAILCKILFASLQSHIIS